MAHGNLQDSARELAGQLVDVVDREDFDTLAGLVPRLIGRQAPEHSLLRPLLGELLTVLAHLVRARSSEISPGDVFSVELTDDVEVDELPPPLRATLRAVLAELNDDHDNARLHLDFIAADPNPLGRLDALVHLVTWVHGLR